MLDSAISKILVLIAKLMIKCGKYLELSKVSMPIPFFHSKMQIFESHYESYICAKVDANWI